MSLTLKELAEELKQMYENAPRGLQITAIHTFGIRFGKELSEGNYSIKDIAKAAGIPESYQNEISEGVRLYNAFKNNTFGISFFDEQSMLIKRSDDSNESKPEMTEDAVKVGIESWFDERAKGGYNKIYYGAPGCGKSHHIKEILNDIEAQPENVFRVTFHPEYMNCDFVGQILPTVIESMDPSSGLMRETVTYQFNPGPFTQALECAYNSESMVYLVIEEINRGNAAAIFGDLFQLLDRVSDITSSNFGGSEYPIRNVSIHDYLVKKSNSKIISHIIEGGIFIPTNMTILATMNSSDQNVFTLDTAFKRRWLFEQISNDITKDMTHGYKDWYIPGTDTTWEAFFG